VKPAKDTASPRSARLGQDFDLRIGETVAIAGEPLIVIFEQVVEDSRCPTDTTCIWAGRGVVRVQLRTTTNAETLNLQTPSDATGEAVFQKYRLRLVQLLPTPTSSNRTPAEQYVATLVALKSE
jgi:hypothetical protein